MGIREWDGHVWTSTRFSVVLHASKMCRCVYPFIRVHALNQQTASGGAFVSTKTT